MAAGTVAAHTDEATVARLRRVAGTENRPSSQILGVALKAILTMSPAARRALYAIDGSAEKTEREFAMKLVGRAALKAYEAIIEARQRGEYHPAGNAPLDTEESIEAEAVRLCRP